VTINVDASVGVATFTSPPTGLTGLLQHAEAALARAKLSIDRIATYDAQFDDAVGDNLALLVELRRAIDACELHLNYQPKIDLATGAVVGAEALIRWNHPVRGEVSPEQFIPLADRTALIQPLTSFVLAEAIGQLGRWRRDGLALTMSVNLSAPNLADPKLPDQIAQLLLAHGVPPSALQLEITETTVMSDLIGTSLVVGRLSALGIELSIDDFGTGYSSLAKLRALPIAEIKLDKTFVGRMLREPEDAAIVASTIGLGHALGLRVVAEGVESEEAALELGRLGCDLAQGYWYSRPEPAALIGRWARPIGAPPRPLRLACPSA